VASHAVNLAILCTHTITYQVTVPLRLEELDCSSVHEAVRKDHFGCLKLLLAKEPAAALQLDEHGETPLQCVEHTLPRCHAVTAALLSAQPAAAVAEAIDAVDQQQRTALHKVVYQAPKQQQVVCEQCLHALCAAGADARISTTGSSVAAAVVSTRDRGTGGATAAASARITALLQALQQGGLDVNDDDACLLYMCAAGEYTDSVTALLACGADVHKGELL
jgi:hypothetical protein